MRPKDQTNWMLSDAIEALARAERLHQSFLNLHPRAGGSEPSWEPPMDVIETEQEILILVALPGVDPDQVEAAPGSVAQVRAAAEPVAGGDDHAGLGAGDAGLCRG